ncbi:hypothetical protein ACFLXQ_07920 [Chloroflexota bacterium]
MKIIFKFKFINILVVLLIVFIGLAFPAWAGGPEEGPLEPVELSSETTGDAQLSTPALLQVALDRGDIDQDTYLLYLHYALGDYAQLPAEYHSNVPWDGTPYVLLLQQGLPNMQDSNKRGKIVAQSGTCGDQSGVSQTITDTTSANFYIQYDAATIGGASGLTLADYRTSLDTYGWGAAIDTYGWAAPPVSSNPPPGNRYHVLIAPLGGGVYGYVYNFGEHAGWADPISNPNIPWNESGPYWAKASCMVLRDDFSGFGGTAQSVLDAATAHEFHHSIQFGYGALSVSFDSNFVEGSAAWMEDEISDASNENYQYLWPDFHTCMGQYPSDGLGYWLVFRGLTERYGTTEADGSEQVMQNYWEIVSNPVARTSAGGVMLNALDVALGMVPAGTI